MGRHREYGEFEEMLAGAGEMVCVGERYRHNKTGGGFGFDRGERGSGGGLRKYDERIKVDADDGEFLRGGGSGRCEASEV